MSAESATETAEEQKNTTAPVDQEPEEQNLTAKEEVERAAAEANAPTIEDLARESGWMSREEFDALPPEEREGKTWHDAIEHIRNEKKIVDSLKKGLRTTQGKLDDMEKNVAALVEDGKRAREREEQARKEADDAKKKAREDLLAELNEKLDEAIEDEDKEAVRKIGQQITALEVEKATEPAEEPPDTGTKPKEEELKQGEPIPEVEAWLGQNSVEDNPENGWYGHFDINDTRFDPVNAACSDYADRRVEEIGKANPNMGWDDLFAQVNKEVEIYRAKLGGGETRQTRKASAAGGGSPANSNKEVTAADLSEVEREEGSRLVKAGEFANLNEYAKALSKL